MSDTTIMQNQHDPQVSDDHLANSRPDLAAIFSSLDADTLSAPLLSLSNLDIIPLPSSNLFTNEQHRRLLIHSLGDTMCLNDPASTAEPSFPTLPPISTTSRKNANPAPICDSTNQNHSTSVAILTANSVRRTGSCSRLSDFGLGISKAVKQRGEPRRKQLSHNFQTLRSLLPNVNVPQLDHCTLIDKACDYIKYLERKLLVLKRKGQILASITESSFGDPRTDEQETRVIVRDEKDKSIMPDSLLVPISSACIPNNEKEACKTEAPHIQITVSRNTININIGFYEKKRLLFPILLEMLESKQLEILSANRSQQRQTVLYAIHVNAQQSRFPSKLELEALQADLYVQVANVILH